MARETKPCANQETCEKLLPLRSKHSFCVRCRAYDKRVASKNPKWVVDLLTAYTRRSGMLAEHVSKKERSNVHFVQFRPGTQHHTQTRKRA